jgi:hypothetical protein
VGGGGGVNAALKALRHPKALLGNAGRHPLDGLPQRLKPLGVVGV